MQFYWASQGEKNVCKGVSVRNNIIPIRGFVERRWMSTIRQCQMPQRQHFHVVEGRYYGAEPNSNLKTLNSQIRFSMTSFLLIKRREKRLQHKISRFKFSAREENRFLGFLFENSN